MDRWETPFGAWVRKYTAPRLRRALQVTRGAIYFWVSGKIQPHPDKAKLMVKLSGGVLSLDDIYDQQRLAKMHWLSEVIT